MDISALLSGLAPLLLVILGGIVGYAANYSLEKQKAGISDRQKLVEVFSRLVGMQISFPQIQRSLYLNLMTIYYFDALKSMTTVINFNETERLQSQFSDSAEQAAKSTQEIFEIFGLILIKFPNPEVKEIVYKFFSVFKENLVERPIKLENREHLDAWRYSMMSTIDERIYRDYSMPIERIVNYLGSELEKDQVVKNRHWWQRLRD